MATRTKPTKKHEHKHAVMQEGDDPDKEVEMCCEGGKTAEEHRKESADGKCCVDE